MRHQSAAPAPRDLIRFILYRMFFFFQAEDGIRDSSVTGVQTCALPISKVPFHLPVLAGVLPGETLMKRGIRVRRMLHLMKDLGGLAEHVSEVDAADLDNLKIVEQVEGNAVTLMMGDRNFSTRLRN